MVPGKTDRLGPGRVAREECKTTPLFQIPLVDPGRCSFDCCRYSVQAGLGLLQAFLKGLVRPLGQISSSLRSIRAATVLSPRLCPHGKSCPFSSGRTRCRRQRLILAGREAPEVIIRHRIACQVRHSGAHPGSVQRIFLKSAGRCEDSCRTAITHGAGNSSITCTERK